MMIKTYSTDNPSEAIDKLVFQFSADGGEQTVTKDILLKPTDTSKKITGTLDGTGDITVRLVPIYSVMPRIYQVEQGQYYFSESLNSILLCKTAGQTADVEPNYDGLGYNQELPDGQAVMVKTRIIGLNNIALLSQESSQTPDFTSNSVSIGTSFDAVDAGRLSIVCKYNPEGDTSSSEQNPPISLVINSLYAQDR